MSDDISEERRTYLDAEAKRKAIEQYVSAKVEHHHDKVQAPWLERQDKAAARDMQSKLKTYDEGGQERRSLLNRREWELQERGIERQAPTTREEYAADLKQDHQEQRAKQVAEMAEQRDNYAEKAINQGYKALGTDRQKHTEQLRELRAKQAEGQGQQQQPDVRQTHRAGAQSRDAYASLKRENESTGPRSKAEQTFEQKKVEEYTRKLKEAERSTTTTQRQGQMRGPRP